MQKLLVAVGLISLLNPASYAVDEAKLIAEMRRKLETVFVSALQADGTDLTRVVPMLKALFNDPTVNIEELQQAFKHDFEAILFQDGQPLNDAARAVIQLRPEFTPTQRTLALGLAAYDCFYGDLPISVAAGFDLKAFGQAYLRAGASALRAKATAGKQLTAAQIRERILKLVDYVVAAEPQSNGGEHNGRGALVNTLGLYLMSLHGIDAFRGNYNYFEMSITNLDQLANFRGDSQYFENSPALEWDALSLRGLVKLLTFALEHPKEVNLLRPDGGYAGMGVSPLLLGIKAHSAKLWVAARALPRLEGREDEREDLIALLSTTSAKGFDELIEMPVRPRDVGLAYFLAHPTQLGADPTDPVSPLMIDRVLLQTPLVQKAILLSLANRQALPRALLPNLQKAAADLRLVHDRLAVTTQPMTMAARFQISRLGSCPVRHEPPVGDQVRALLGDSFLEYESVCERMEILADIAASFSYPQLATIARNRQQIATAEERLAAEYFLLHGDALNGEVLGGEPSTADCVERVGQLKDEPRRSIGVI